MFIIALYLTAKAWKPPKGSLTDESLEKMWSASTQWGTFQLLEKESCHVTVDGHWGHYAEWNKSDKDRFCSLPFMWNLKSKTQKERSDLWFSEVLCVCVKELQEHGQELEDK